MQCIEASVVSVQDSLFDDPLFADLKVLNHEQLLTEAIELMESLEWKELAQTDLKEIALLKNKMRGDLQKLVVLLGEIYRRNICPQYNQQHLIHLGMLNTFLEDDCCFFCKEKNVDYCIAMETDRLFGKKVNKSNLICLPCKVKHAVNQPGSETIDKLSIVLIEKGYLDRRQWELYRNFPFYLKGYLDYLKTPLQDMQTVKEIMVKILRTPLLTKELEELMDEILDLNGNKISQMKDYLTPEEYRFVRSGCPFEEFPKQQEMLTKLKKMRDELKG
jgi:hypothetical protein